MIKIEHNNNQYKIYWFYTKYSEGTYKAQIFYKKKKNRRDFVQFRETKFSIVSTCILKDLNINEIKIYGKAKTHPKDSFKKSIGRELSLERVLNQIDDNEFKEKIKKIYIDRKNKLNENI